MTTRKSVATASNRSAATALSVVAVGLMLTACTTVTTTAPNGERTIRSKKDFGDYVEQVFRYQNRVADDLIIRYELASDTDPEIDVELSAAEERMQQNCRYLNEMVTTSVEGREPRLDLKKKLVETIAACDASAHEVAGLIKSSKRAAALDPGHAPE